MAFVAALPAVGAAVARILPMVASTAGRAVASTAGRAAASGVARAGGGELSQGIARQAAQRGTGQLINAVGNHGNQGEPRRSSFLEGARSGPDVFS